MPTYEYRCEACDHEFEEFQGMTEDPLVKCPKCKKRKLRRLFGCGAAVLFKGSGFYETDYRSQSYKSAAKADQEKSQPPAEGKTEKPAKADKPGKPGKADITSAKPARKS